MKKVFLLGTLLTIAFFTNGRTGESKQWLYVGTFTTEGAGGVYLCSFDPETGDLRLEKTFRGFDDPSFLKISPDRKFLYVVNRAPLTVEPAGGYIVSFRIMEDHSLEFMNKQLTHGEGPCYVDVSPTGKWAGVANYSSGTVSMFSIGADGTLSPATAEVRNQGSGPDKARQSGPHAHSFRFYAGTGEVFSPDLGTDKVMRFEPIDKNGTLRQQGQLFLPLAPGSGPRHLEFYPSKEIIYVISELSSTITGFSKTGDKWTEFQTVSTLPSGFSGESFCADIHISKDAKFLYGSNRGHNSIAVFRIATSDGRLTPVGYVPTQGNWPRNFTLSPDGNFMLVGNQRSGNITVFKINHAQGLPEFTGIDLKVASPVCIEFL